MCPVIVTEVILNGRIGHLVRGRREGGREGGEREGREGGRKEGGRGGGKGRER